MRTRHFRFNPITADIRGAVGTSALRPKQTSVRARPRPLRGQPPLCSASDLFRRQQCQKGDAADDGENRAVDKHGRMANVVPQ